MTLFQEFGADFQTLLIFPPIRWIHNDSMFVRFGGIMILGNTVQWLVQLSLTSLVLVFFFFVYIQSDFKRTVGS